MGSAPWVLINQTHVLGLEIGEGHSLLVEVDPLGSRGETAHEGEIAAVATHDLDHEAAIGGHRALFDLVHRLDDGVQGGVGADAEFGTREIVVDGRRQADSPRPVCPLCHGHPRIAARFHSQTAEFRRRQTFFVLTT